MLKFTNKVGVVTKESDMETIDDITL